MEPIARKLINSIQYTAETGSFAEAMHAVLTGAGWTEASRDELAGMTVCSFRFHVHRRLLAESPTAYNWRAENFLAADFIGIASGVDAGFVAAPTFPLYREHAIATLKKSVDRGVGAVIWHNGFVAVKGYDDAEQVLMYADGRSPGDLRLPYCSFGLNGTPYWFYQTFEQAIQLDPIEVYRESLIQAVFKWETHDSTLPAGEYACGKIAYDAILAALESGDYDASEAAYTLSVYAAYKRDIASYLTKIQGVWADVSVVAGHYSELDALWAHIRSLVMEGLAGKEFSPRVPMAELLETVARAKVTEEQAIQATQLLLREKIGNRFDDIGLR